MTTLQEQITKARENEAKYHEAWLSAFKDGEADRARDIDMELSQAHGQVEHLEFLIAEEEKKAAAQVNFFKLTIYASGPGLTIQEINKLIYAIHAVGIFGELVITTGDYGPCDVAGNLERPNDPAQEA